ncbi:MAG: tetratricopeptide repeat protein [Phycisphaerales bacterium]|nr:tetratricopeptide repeat protein [Phycisphaerales bacterium]
MATSMLARTVLGLSTAAMVVLAGCGQGQYTKEGKTAAVEKMAMLKSGTEWQMAHQQFLAGDLTKALKTVDRSIALNGKVPKSRVLRGRIMLERSRLEEARNEMLTALELDPNFVDAHYYLGVIYERVNQPADAMASYKKAMELDSANAQYVVAAAEMLISKEDLAGAETLLNERKQFLQYNPAIRQTMGHIATLRNDHAQAAQLFEEALLLAPGDQAITEDLIQSYLLARQFADAESHIGKLLDKKENADRRDLKYMRARCLMALNRPVEAREILQQLTSAKEGAADLRAWVDLGNVAAILRDKATLRQTMQRVQAMAPDKSDGFMLRAMYCRLDNRPDDALNAINQAVARAGNDATPLVFKSIVLQDLGRSAEARATLAQARQVDPNNVQAMALLQQIESGRTITGHPDGEQ